MSKESGRAAVDDSNQQPQMLTEIKGPILEYAPPPPPGKGADAAKAFAIGLAKFLVVLILFVAGMNLFPEGSWNFGHLHVSLDRRDLVVGRSGARGDLEDEYFHVDTFPLLFAEMILLGVPIWIINRIWQRRGRAKESDIQANP